MRKSGGEGMWSVDRQGGLTKFSCRWSGRNVPEIPTCFRTACLSFSLLPPPPPPPVVSLSLSLFRIVSSWSSVSASLFRWPLFSSPLLSLARTDKGSFVPADRRLHSPLHAAFFFSFFLSLSLSLCLSFSLCSHRPLSLSRFLRESS